MSTSSFFHPPPADQVTSSPDDDVGTLYPEEGSRQATIQIRSAENTIAEALKELSLEEREQVFMDQHGVADIPQFGDDSELIEQKLEELEKNLQTLTSDSEVPAEAYKLAEKLEPKYVRDRLFRLRFLYAEMFDTQKAASRMVRHFNYKREIFGDHKLTKDLGLDDLTADELTYLREGYVQRLPSRDSAGRPVVVIFPLLASAKGSDVFGRMLSVQGCSSSGAIESKGIVVVAYHLVKRQNEGLDWNAAYMSSRAVSDLAVRISAVHHCFGDGRFPLQVQRFMDMSDKETRAKHKMHCGSHTKCMNELMSYGIPQMLMPIAGDGTIKRKNHLDWLRQREIIEEYRRSGITVEVVDLPQNTDVLLGRGRPIQEHRGNVNLQHIVDDLLPHYDAMKGTKAKKQLSLQIVQMIKGKKGRFLSQESGVWTEVPDSIAREKVSHLFRNRRKQSKTQSQPIVTIVDGAPFDRTGCSPLKDVKSSSKRVKVG